MNCLYWYRAAEWPSFDLQEMTYKTVLVPNKEVNRAIMGIMVEIETSVT